MECRFDYGNWGYYCSWNNKIYTSLKECHEQCKIKLYNNKELYISQEDFTFLVSLFFVLMSALFVKIISDIS